MVDHFTQMDKIIDGLYLGNIQGASNIVLLKQKGITHILQVAAGFNPFFPGQFHYNVINILDMPYENIMKYFKSSVEWIKNAIRSGGKVLVHCYAGISRSASVVIAYLMKELGLPMLDAMTYTRKRRAIVFPNPGFQRQLFEYEKLLRQNNQKSMQEYQDKKRKKIQDVTQRQSGSAFLQQEKIIRLAQESKNFSDISQFRSPQPQLSKDENAKNKLKNLMMQANLEKNQTSVSQSSTVKQNTLAKLLIQAYGHPQHADGRPMTEHQIQRNHHQDVGDKKDRKSVPFTPNHHQSNNVTNSDLHYHQDIMIKKLLQGQDSSLSRPVDKKVLSATVKQSPSHINNPLGISMGFNINESSYKRDYSLKPLEQANQLNVKKQNSNLTPQKQGEQNRRDHKGIKEQRSTNFILKDEYLRESKPTAQAVSQQYFYTPPQQQANKVSASSRLEAEKFSNQQRVDQMTKAFDASNKPPMIQKGNSSKSGNGNMPSQSASFQKDVTSKRNEKSGLNQPNAYKQNEQALLSHKGEHHQYPLTLRSPQPLSNSREENHLEKRHHRDDQRHYNHHYQQHHKNGTANQSALAQPGMLSFDNRVSNQPQNLREQSLRRRV